MTEEDKWLADLGYDILHDLLHEMLPGAVKWIVKAETPPCWIVDNKLDGVGKEVFPAFEGMS